MFNKLGGRGRRIVGGWRDDGIAGAERLDAVLEITYIGYTNAKVLADLHGDPGADHLVVHKDLQLFFGLLGEFNDGARKPRGHLGDPDPALAEKDEDRHFEIQDRADVGRHTGIIGVVGGESQAPMPKRRKGRLDCGTEANRFSYEGCERVSAASCGRGWEPRAAGAPMPWGVALPRGGRSFTPTEVSPGG